MVTKERGRSLQRKAPKSKAFRADTDAGCVSRGKALEKILSALRRFLNGQCANPTSKHCIACQSHPATIRVNTLEHLKTKKGSGSKGTHAATTITCTNSLRTILNHDDVVLFRNSHDLCHRARLTIQMRGNDCAGAFGHSGFNLIRIQIEACRI